MAHGSWKKPLHFDGNSDNISLGLGLAGAGVIPTVAVSVAGLWLHGFEFDVG